MKRFVLRFFGVAFGVLVCASQAAEKPVLYNRVREELTQLDEDVRKAYEAKFDVVDLRVSSDFQAPKLAAGQVPRAARTPEGKQFGGNLLLAYIVNPDGRAAQPVVFKTTDERLIDVAFSAMREWRFTPGTLKGEPVAVAALQEFTFETTPTEFELQVLEPTGGSISKPKGWFYADGHESSMYMWTISREDTSAGTPYTTGVRIQAFLNVKKEMNQTPKEFIQDFIATKKKKAEVRVLKTCDEERQGLFNRSCLEIEEGPYHILCSLFWGGEGLDIAVITMAGTVKELWETYSPAFERMSAFELFDQKRLQKK